MKIKVLVSDNFRREAKELLKKFRNIENQSPMEEDDSDKGEAELHDYD